MAATTVSTNPTIDLSSLLTNSPAQFLQPTRSHQHAAITSVKAVLDPLAAQIIQAQTVRRNENKRKRKRGSDEVEDLVLQLRSIYTNGLAVKQVWEQARRVLDAVCDEVERGLDEYVEKYGNIEQDEDGVEDEDLMEDEQELLSEDADEDEEGGMELDESDDDSIDGLIEDEENEDEFDGEDIENEELDVMDYEDELLEDRPQATYKPDPNNLNDGFFSIDDFNKQSQFLEQMDARGDDDNPSDEEEVDWDADPLTQPMAEVKAKGGLHRQEAEDEDDEAGPTFGNVDLNAPDSESEGGDEDVDGGDLDGMMSGLANTNEIRYADFFEPPPKKPSKGKKMRALPKTQPPPEAELKVDGNEDEADLERAMADVRRDLLDSDDEVAEDERDDEDDLSDADRLPRLSASKLHDKNLSTHEKQRLQIAEEIKRLEAINVSKKPWQQSGEASAQARPMNSLIEEDLEFERTGKPVPVITAEVSTDIEALIKRRILSREFDEVVRRRPTTLDSAADARRGRSNIVVDDNKPMQGLGEIYEEQYQRNADPTTYVDKRSAATKKQHAEIEKLWKEVRDQLDVLANLHIKPKRAEVEIKTVEDKPRIAMEDAQPAASGDIDGDGTMLAPQEIYKPGADSRANDGEVLNAKSGVTRNKEELSREEKVRKRRREKERQKKAGSNQPTSVTAVKTGRAKKQAEQEQVLKDLQKGGAKVIGKNGQLQDLSSKRKDKGDVRDTSTFSGGAFKL